MKAHASLGDDRIIVRVAGFKGDEEFQEQRDRSKAVGACRWDGRARGWSYPTTIDTCTALRRVWGDDLVVLPALSDWYRREAQKGAQQAERSTATDATLTSLPTVAPMLAATLRPDQRVGVQWVAAGYRGSGLVADQPGLGKTLEVIGGILEEGAPGSKLIVCPRLSVRPVWFRELKRWTNESVHMARGTRAQRQKAIDAFMADPSERKWLIIVMDMLRVERKAREEKDLKSITKRRGRVEGFSFPDLFDHQWDTVVVDESQRSFGSLTVAKSTLAGEGLATIGKKVRRRIAISATPFGKGGRVQGMFGTLHWLWPDEFTSYWRWVDTYFETEEKYIGRGKTAKQIVGLRPGLSEEAFLKGLGPRILRRTKAEVLPNLKPKEFQTVWCEMTPAQEKQYAGLTLDAEIVAPGGVVSANGTLAQLTRFKQVANGCLGVGADGSVQFTDDSGKIDMLMHMLEKRGIVDGSGTLKVLVASQYNEFLQAVQQRLTDNYVKYHLLIGSTSDKERDRIMEEFMAEGGPRVFLLNSKAGGVSITLDSADEVHCLDEMWSPEDQEQLEDRVHRASRMHQVTIFYYRSEGTIDEAIAETVEHKRTGQHNVLDGRRGIDYLRSVTEYRMTKEN